LYFIAADKSKVQCFNGCSASINYQYFHHMAE